MSPTEGHLFHNRLTHTLKVAQIARRLAEKLLVHEAPELVEAVGGVDPDVTEAAALAHDPGHPPFGHIAEEVLDELVVKDLPDAFEGNAQSFRIVTRLAVRKRHINGLNLTRATLNALLKYPSLRQPSGKFHRKYGAYSSEQTQFEFARALHASGDREKSAEAELMDWSDDIAYSVHDIEDFYRAGLIPLDRLAREDDELDRFTDTAARTIRSYSSVFGEDELKDAFKSIFLPTSEPYRGTSTQRAAIRSFTSTLIGRYSQAIRLSAPTSKQRRRVTIDRTSEMEVAMLKQLTWYYVINNPALAAQQYGQKRVIRELFGIFMEAALSPRSSVRALLPIRCQEQLEDARGAQELDNETQRVTRVVVDLVASLTEQEAIKMHQRLTGIASGSVADAVVR